MTLQELRDDARYKVSPNLTAAQYPDAKLDKNLNNWYRTIIGWAIRDQGEWEVNGDYMVIDLEEDVSEYEIPVGLIRVYKAEVMYKTGGSYVPVTQYSVQANQDVAAGNTNLIMGTDQGSPLMEVFGDILKLSPTPTETVVNGFKIWAQLDAVDMNDTNEQLPDLNPLVVEAISTGAAMDYASSKEMYAKELSLKRRLFGDPRVPDDTGFKGQVSALYSMKTGDRRDRVVARRQSFR